MNKIKRGDDVVVLCGQHKGKRGVVRRVINDEYGKPRRVLVEGVNMATHYERPNPQENQPGGLIKREASIHVSNVAIVDADSGKPVRVKIIQGENGKVRALPSGKEIA